METARVYEAKLCVPHSKEEWREAVFGARSAVQSQNSCVDATVETRAREDCEAVALPTPSEDISQPASLSSPTAIEILNFPLEIVEHILDYMMGPYDLVVSPFFYHFNRNQDVVNEFTKCVFLVEKPRTWSSMKIFHINKLLRTLAINRYGAPEESSLPFNPTKDVLVVSLSGQSLPQPRWLRRHMLRPANELRVSHPVSRETQLETEKMHIAWQLDKDTSPTSLDRQSMFLVRTDISDLPHHLPTLMSPEWMKRITTVSIGHPRTTLIHHHSDWSSLSCTLAHMASSMKTLELVTLSTDNCYIDHGCKDHLSSANKDARRQEARIHLRDGVMLRQIAYDGVVPHFNMVETFRVIVKHPGLCTRLYDRGAMRQMDKWERYEEVFSLDSPL
ncbi:hypothetical protein F4778DRAFT_728949 [Xylariomycetidae sp. FL2044]|nr:hypothetical protein F4778DRAFT_728949 [Xylariomycetidae sp. FL2044]